MDGSNLRVGIFVDILISLVSSKVEGEKLAVFHHMFAPQTFRHLGDNKTEIFAPGRLGHRRLLPNRNLEDLMLKKPYHSASAFWVIRKIACYTFSL